ncbi:hypothetical protein F511_46546 [Dorcoceras hygrometricum]|uniref:Uncharacterized protein n=1 Tax=Dorcoceras hygrometricum TaxID=472368 RepID=A0A2Z6ZTS5_9LAMI|nr:hypothetical protein F511_46546 [Dorcoceras hygrometricum]
MRRSCGMEARSDARQIVRRSAHRRNGGPPALRRLARRGAIRSASSSARASDSDAIFAASARPLARRVRGQRASSARIGAGRGSFACGAADQSTCDDIPAILI